MEAGWRIHRAEVVATVTGMRWLVALLGLSAVLAAIREWRIRSLEARHDPDRTP
jgi:hypothetical protein